MVLLSLIFLPLTSTPAEKLTVTVLYDNYVYKEGTKADWGFSCIIKGTEKTILFDTGTKPEILFHNFKVMEVNPEEIQLVAISHNHGDHTGGLFKLLEKNHRVTVYLPDSFPDFFFNRVKKHQAQVVKVNQPLKICQHVHLTGEMGDRIKEQSLILDTKKGGIVIAGCSHPGIIKIIKKARTILEKNIYMVFGGFHLMNKTEAEMHDIIAQFRHLGVQKIGATHCTGDKQIEMFKKAYGEHFIRIGTGKVLVFN